MSRTPTPVGGRMTPTNALRSNSGVTSTQRGYSSGGGANNHVSASQILQTQPLQQYPGESRSGSLSVQQLEEHIYMERLTRAAAERRLLEFEHVAAAERLVADEQHRRRLLEMYLVAGHMQEDRKTECGREKRSIESSAMPAVIEQLQKVAHHTEVERSVVDALRRQLEAKLGAQRVEATKEREKVQFYRTMLIRRMRQLEEHVRMVCGTDHWLLRLPDLADREKPFTSVSGFSVQSSPAAKMFDSQHSPVPSAANGGGYNAGAAGGGSSSTPGNAHALNMNSGSSINNTNNNRTADQEGTSSSAVSTAGSAPGAAISRQRVDSLKPKFDPAARRTM